MKNLTINCILFRSYNVQPTSASSTATAKRQREDLQLARAALRSQGAGGMFCRDAFGLTALHHAAQGKPQIHQVEMGWQWDNMFMGLHACNEGIRYDHVYALYGMTLYVHVKIGPRTTCNLGKMPGESLWLGTCEYQ